MILIKHWNDTYEVKDHPLFYGKSFKAVSLVELYKIWNDLFFSIEELDFGIVEMNKHDHNCAYYGDFRATFIFSDDYFDETKVA